PSVSMPDRLRAMMTGALIYATATIWLANLVLLHGVPSPRYLLPASFPFLYLVADRMRNLAPRTTIMLGGLESLALLLLAFAPHALLILQIAVEVIVTLYALATIARQTVRRSTAVVPARSLWPAVTICLCAILLAGGDIILLSKRGAAQTLTLAEV